MNNIKIATLLTEAAELLSNNIDKYVEDTGIPESILYENRHNERLELQEYLERDRFLCQLHLPQVWRRGKA